jgi:integrase
MGGKRANGEGSIYQRSDGRWCSAIVADDPVTGARHRTVLYGKTRTEVRHKLKAATERADVGGPVRDAKASVAAWLAQWRETTLAASNRKETTQELYKSLSMNHLEPEPFGSIPLDRLRPSDVDRLVLTLRDKKLSDATIQRIFGVLRVALAAAVRDGLIARNPAASVKQPSVARSEARYLSPAEVSSVLAAAEGSRYHTVLWLIAATGLRRGEALALKWSDVDLKNGSLTVRSTLSRVGGALTVTEPKTPKSRRTLHLSPSVVAMLKAHRQRQRLERVRAGAAWQTTDHVFATEAGGPVEPRNLFRALATAAESAGIEDVGPHTLRHSAATAWLENGVNLKAVSELLGHADIRITADCYGHVSEETSRAAMNTLADVLGL